ncbi:DUF5412 domain-containing protein [Jeotgalibacillus malaysiensis]|uniref:DUF5412 domain-containing protein n=1 Tax=Jeotgalibacillus malaysiensis TaxID=1508404 RepID=UPI00384FC46C
MAVFKKVLIGVLAGFLLILGLIALLIFFFFYSMDRLTEGEFMTEETSPDGTYTLKAYLTNGGATVAYAVRGELVTNDSGKTKNISWQYREEEAEIEWLDEDTVVINGVELDVPGERYDYRKD